MCAITCVVVVFFFTDSNISGYKGTLLGNQSESTKTKGAPKLILKWGLCDQLFK